MLNSIVRGALRLRGLVMVGAALMVAYGTYTASHARLGVFLDVADHVRLRSECIRAV